MGLELNYIDGQTPLDEDEKEGLLIPTISTREELDQFEQKNIEEAFQWLLGKSFTSSKVFTEKFVCEVHKRMFSEVWKWAGKFRHSQKNIGVDYRVIPQELHSLLADAALWLERKVYSPDEFAIRFKHKIVSIHCFSNGNGRHCRMMADIIVEKIFNRKPFSWGDSKIEREGDSRNLYLTSLKEADSGSYESLIKFARL